jgi:hypothetical protein
MPSVGNRFSMQVNCQILIVSEISLYWDCERELPVDQTPFEDVASRFVGRARNIVARQGPSEQRTGRCPPPVRTNRDTSVFGGQGVTSAYRQCGGSLSQHSVPRHPFSEGRPQIANAAALLLTGKTHNAVLAVTPTFCGAEECAVTLMKCVIEIGGRQLKTIRL